jgi:uncharacterized membrane protein
MAGVIDTAMDTVTLVAAELETQSLNSVVAGFSFAAAMSWMDFVRWSITQIVKVPKNGGSQYVLTALLTTLLSVVIFLIVTAVNGRVSKPAQPVYAITR